MIKTRLISRLIIICILAFICFGMDKAFASTESALQEKTEKKKASSYLEKDTHKGKVLETMNSGGYTYIQFEENGQTLWAAAPEFKVSVGDKIEFSSALPMKDFNSKKLNKTFELIYFISVVKVGDSPTSSVKSKSLPEGHAPIKAVKARISVKPGSIKKAKGGWTISECFINKDSLKGKTIKVRGKVVRFSGNIMGRNWMHIRDGTGKEGTNDLTVTAKQKVQVGEVILVSGKMDIDKNVGVGYFYPIIIEDATIKIEKKQK